jgi:hypothetical protein
MPTDVITVKKRAFFRDLAKKKMSERAQQAYAKSD